MAHPLTEDIGQSLFAVNISIFHWNLALVPMEGIANIAKASTSPRTSVSFRGRTGGRPLPSTYTTHGMIVEPWPGDMTWISFETVYASKYIAAGEGQTNSFRAEVDRTSSYRIETFDDQHPDVFVDRTVQVEPLEIINCSRSIEERTCARESLTRAKGCR